MLKIEEYYRPEMFGDSVMIKVTFNRKRKYYPFLFNHERVHLSETEFESLRKKKTPAKLSEIKHELKSELARFGTVAGSIKPFDFESFDRKIKPNSGNLFKMWEQYAETCDLEGRHNTAESHRFSIKKLIAFKHDLTFNELSTELLRKFSLWGKKKGYSGNTIAICLRNLRTIVNLVKVDYPDLKNPFGRRKFVIKDAAGKRGDALTLDQLRTFINSDCPEQYQFAKDLFLFSFYGQGINYGDLARLKYSDLKADHIEFIRKKTADTSTKARPILLPLDDFMRGIIIKYGTKRGYIFPILSEGLSEPENIAKIKSSISVFNKHLKAYCVKIGLPKISSYWSRHTWATLQLELGTATALISQALGHANITQTESYLKTLSVEKFSDAQAKMKKAI